MTPRIDTPAALIVQKILNGEFCKLTLDERLDFAYFILSLRARHPDAVALANAKGLEAITSALARDPDEYEAVKGSASPPTLTEWTRQNAPSLIPNFGMSRIPGLIIHDKTVEHRMPWWIHDVHHANTDLLLSDRPCLLEGNAVEGECLIALPLSPTMLFFICNREHPVEELLSMQPTSLVKGVNRASVLSAADRVYGTGTHHLTLVEKFLRSDNGPPR